MTDTLSDKQISLIADQINEGNLRNIAVLYFDFSYSDLYQIDAQNLSWLRNCHIIEIWREKNPAEHHATVRIFCKNKGFQFLL